MIPRKKPLAQFSAKRLDEIKAAGRIPWSTFTPRLGNRSTPRESKPKQRLRDTSPDTAAVEMVINRDGGCVRCLAPIRGVRGLDYSIHHRKLRSQGLDNSVPALIVLCGDGVRLCHGWAHAERTQARDLGLIVRGRANPAASPLRHARFGWVLLTADGGWVPSEPIGVAA